MRAISLAVFAILLSSCAPATEGESAREQASKIVTGLPDAGCTIVSSGSHQFCAGAVEQVTLYDCGMRGSLHCWHYAHSADAQNPVSHSESACIPLYTSGLECLP